VSKPRLGLRGPRLRYAQEQPNIEATLLAPTTDGRTRVGAGNSIDGGRPRNRHLNLDREAQDALADQEDEDEEEEDEVEATKEEDRRVDDADIGEDCNATSE
jgi:hypothetical protein